MEKKAENAPLEASIKKHVEGIAHDVEVSPEQLRSLSFPAGAYAYADGTAVWRNILIFPGKSCNAATLLDVSGVSSTGADGTRVFLLSDFVCLPQVHSLGEPINVVATPRSRSPFFLTMTHSLLNPGTFQSDVQIMVFTWDANGAAAPNVTFDWRCRVVSLQIIL